MRAASPPADERDRPRSVGVGAREPRPSRPPPHARARIASRRSLTWSSSAEYALDACVRAAVPAAGATRFSNSASSRSSPAWIAVDLASLGLVPALSRRTVGQRHVQLLVGRLERAQIGADPCPRAYGVHRARLGVAKHRARLLGRDHHLALFQSLPLGLHRTVIAPHRHADRQREQRDRRHTGRRDLASRPFETATEAAHGLLCLLAIAHSVPVPFGPGLGVADPLLCYRQLGEVPLSERIHGRVRQFPQYVVVGGGLEHYP